MLYIIWVTTANVTYQGQITSDTISTTTKGFCKDILLLMVEIYRGMTNSFAQPIPTKRPANIRN